MRSALAGWHLDPELAEDRELLAARQAGADRKPPRRETVALLAPQHPEIAGADEGDQLVEDARIVQRIMQSEAGKAEIDRQRLLELHPAIVEQIGRIGHRRRHAVAHHIDHHRAREQEARMEHLHPERRAVRRQQRPVGPEADVAPGVEIEPRERLGQARPGLVGGGRDLAGPAHHVLEAEAGLRRGWRRCRLSRRLLREKDGRGR